MLRWIDGFELGLPASRYNAGSLSFDWTTTTGAGGAPSLDYTGVGRWVPTTGSGGDFGCQIPEGSTVATRSLQTTNDPDITSWVVAFSLALNANAAGVSANAVLAEVLDQGGNTLARLSTGSSGSPFSVKGEVLGSSGMVEVFTTDADWEVGTAYWVIMEFRRTGGPTYSQVLNLYRGTLTSDPVQLRTGTPVSTTNARELGRIRWTGAVSNAGGGAGDTIVDSAMLWTDPDADAPYCFRKWYVARARPLIVGDQALVGDGTYTPNGAPANSAAVRRTDASKYSKAVLTTGGATVTQAMEFDDLSQIDASMVFPVVRDIGGVCVTFTNSDTAGITQIGGFLFRGGSYLPFGGLDLYYSGNATEQYHFRAYGVDPVGERWNARTFDAASLVMYVDGGSATSSTRFQVMVAQVAWNGQDPVDTSSVVPGPEKYVLVHDPALVATDASLASKDGVDTPSQQGPAIGPLYPDTTNEGNMMPFHAGDDWDTSPNTKHPTPVGLDYRLQVAGGVMGNAEWSWRFGDDPHDRYRGALDLRLERDVCRPWSTNIEAESLIAFTSKAFNRILAGRYQGPPDYRWQIQYMATSPVNRTTWHGETYIPDAAGLLAAGLAPNKLPKLSNCSYSCTWETPDGALRFAYVYERSGALTSDMDIWGSTDGGFTWSIIQEGVLGGVMGRNTRPMYMTCDTSGDWVRISFWDLSSTPQGICTIASSDRGATWTLVQGTPDGEDVFATGFNPEQFQKHDIVGVDTVDGMFLRMRKVASTPRMRLEVASGTDDWTEHPGTTPALWAWRSTNLESLQAVRTPTHLVFLGWYTDGTNDDSILSGLMIQRDHVLDYSYTAGVTKPRTQEWTVFAKFNGAGCHPLREGAYHQPARWRACWTGDSILVVQGVYNLGASSGRTVQGYTVCSFLGGWDQFPTHGTEAATVGRDDGLYECVWLPHYGAPDAPLAVPPFTKFTAGSPSVSSFFTGIDLLCGASDRVHFFRSGPGDLGDQGAVEWSTQLATGVTNFTIPTFSGNYMLPKCGVSITATTGAGSTIHVGVHLTDAGVYMYDGLAATTLFSDASVNAATERTYRLRFSDSAGVGRAGINSFVELQHKAMGTDGPWVSSGLITTSVGHLPGYGVQMVRWGHLALPGGTVISKWYGFAVADQEAIGGRPGFTNPDSLRGAQCATYPYHTAHGVYVTWGGGGGFNGDRWSSSVVYEYGVDQLASPSPSMVWRTDGHTTTTVIMDAAKYRDTAGQTITDRFHHNAVALVGTNFRYAYVDYANTTAFSATVPAAAMTVDAAVFHHVIDALGTNTVSLAPEGPAGYRDMHFRSNSVAGWFAQYSAPTAGSTYDGNVYRILESWDDTVRVDFTTEKLTTSMVAGGTLTFFPPWMVMPYSAIDPAYAYGLDARYMRIQLRTTGNQIPATDTGFQVGRLVAGMTLPISVPMEWEGTDTEEGNVSLFTADNGVRASYKQGQPRKTVEGTSVGDVSRWRESWRGTIRTISQYDLHPMVLVRDATADTLSALYGRMVQSTELANVGYRYNTSTGRWEAVGDVSMTWEEEV